MIAIQAICSKLPSRRNFYQRTRSTILIHSNRSCRRRSGHRSLMKSLEKSASSTTKCRVGASSHSSISKSTFSPIMTSDCIRPNTRWIWKRSRIFAIASEFRNRACRKRDMFGINIGSRNVRGRNSMIHFRTLFDRSSRCLVGRKRYIVHSEPTKWKNHQENLNHQFDKMSTVRRDNHLT